MNENEGSATGTLEGLIAAMRHLLDVVDTKAEDEELLIGAWQRCQALLDSYLAKSATVSSQSEEERAETRAHLQTAVRLNAIVTHLVQRESERVRTELDVLRDAKRKLRMQISRSSRTGGSVDLAG
jgi:hypothetical protein